MKLQSKAAPKAADGENAPAAGPDLSDLFDALNSLGDDLRQETNEKFALIKDFTNFKAETEDNFTGVKRRVDNSEKQQNNLESRIANVSQDTKKDM